MAVSENAGIICEYNPFHNGHEWMIKQIKQLGAKTVVCVMSGNFVQRAEPAFFPAHIRAKAALSAGADLVLRLPMPYSCMSAEGFAAAAVGILAALCCVDTLFFGAETSETETLVSIAKTLKDSCFDEKIKQHLNSGLSFAAARAAAAEEILPGAQKVLCSPNNILGIEYCKALLNTVPEFFAAGGYEKQPLPTPYALPRIGAQHDGTPISTVASASWLRQAVHSGNIKDLQKYVPAPCLDIYTKAEINGERINTDKWNFAQLARLKGLASQDFSGYYSAGDGLAARLAKSVHAANNMQSAIDMAKTKRFAHSRIRRLALEACLNLPKDVPPVPPFVHVLAANPKGIALLKKAKSSSILPISTSLAKLGCYNENAKKIVELEAASEALYALCQNVPQKSGRIFTQPATII